MSHNPLCGFSDEHDCESNCPIHGLDKQSGDRSGTRIGNSNNPTKKEGNKLFGGTKQDYASDSHCYRDKGGASRYFKHAEWGCEDGCAIHMLNEQSGKTKSNPRPPTGRALFAPDEEGRSVKWNANNVRDTTVRGHKDEGGASRFFYCAKASKSEKMCNGKIENKHPTVKPVKLLEWIAFWEVEQLRLPHKDWVLIV